MRIYIGIIFFIFFNLSILNSARVAEVKMKNKIIPIKIVNLKFFHYKYILPTSYFVVSLKEKRFKYIKFHVNEIKKIKFIKCVGERNLYPTYLVHIFLEKGGHYISAYNIPLKEIVGIKNGKKWRLKLRVDRVYEKNVYNLYEIKFYEYKKY